MSSSSPSLAFPLYSRFPTGCSFGLEHTFCLLSFPFPLYLPQECEVFVMVRSFFFFFCPLWALFIATLSFLSSYRFRYHLQSSYILELAALATVPWFLTFGHGVKPGAALLPVILWLGYPAVCGFGNRGAVAWYPTSGSAVSLLHWEGFICMDCGNLVQPAACNGSECSPTEIHKVS